MNRFKLLWGGWVIWLTWNKKDRYFAGHKFWHNGSCTSATNSNPWKLLKTMKKADLEHRKEGIMGAYG